MAKELTWSDADDIGILLSETHPKIDPLAVRFTDLHK
jgi:FeS assembly protein IscX